MVNLIKREKELYKNLTKDLENGFFVFLKYNYFNLIWRIFGKSKATKYCDKSPTIIKFKDGSKLRVKWLLHFVSICIDGEYTGNELFKIKNGQKVLDLGANFGYYTFLASRRVGEDGKVIAVEPFENYIKELKNNVESNNLKNVTIVEGAAAGKEGEIDLFIGENFGSPSLVKHKDKSVKVKTITLKKIFQDNKIDKIDILKMDIEGGEIDILKNSKEALKKIKSIVMETHNNLEEVKGLLEINGYSIVSDFENGRIIYAVSNNQND